MQLFSFGNYLSLPFSFIIIVIAINSSLPSHRCWTPLNQVPICAIAIFIYASSCTLHPDQSVSQWLVHSFELAQLRGLRACYKCNTLSFSSPKTSLSLPRDSDTISGTDPSKIENHFLLSLFLDSVLVGWGVIL